MVDRPDSNPITIEPATPDWWKRAALLLGTTFVRRNRPLELQGYATADLPNPAQWRRHLVYDLTTDTVKVSDGATWNAL